MRQMIELYERFRTFTSLEWSIDWSSLSLNSILRAFCGKDQGEERKYVLILGTFHPNGYFWERCMEELVKESGALPYLMLRANDWVKPVREKAFFLLNRYIASCSVEEILFSMPMLEKLESSGRRSDEQLQELKIRIFAKLEQILKGEGWRDIWAEDFSVRKSLYRMAKSQGILHMEQMDEWLRREKDSFGMTMLIKGILSHPDCTLERAKKYTLLALGRQEDFENEELLWKYLLDEQEDISKAACISIQKRGFYPGAKKLYCAYCSSKKEHQKRYLLRLLLRESSWNRLPWLIRLYNEGLPEQEKQRVKGGIHCRFMYARVPEMQKEEICKALKEKAGKLPKGMEEEICYDMKFV